MKHGAGKQKYEIKQYIEKMIKQLGKRISVKNMVKISE